MRYVVDMMEIGTTRTGDIAEQASSQSRDFESFFDRERGSLFRFLALVTGSAHEADDLTQEAFVKLWERWAYVSQLANPAGYLRRTAINLFRSRYRHAAYVAKRRFSLGREVRDPLSVVEERDAAFRVLRTLTRRQRAAVVLTELLGYTVEEASVALGIRPGTVRALTSQARARVAMTGEAGDE
jgi:RNA polymerase sigma-70 factor (ECF subfamily)